MVAELVTVHTDIQTPYLSTTQTISFVSHHLIHHQQGQVRIVNFQFSFYFRWTYMHIILTISAYLTGVVFPIICAVSSRHRPTQEEKGKAVLSRPSQLWDWCVLALDPNITLGMLTRARKSCLDVLNNQEHGTTSRTVGQYGSDFYGSRCTFNTLNLDNWESIIIPNELYGQPVTMVKKDSALPSEWSRSLLK